MKTPTLLLCIALVAASVCLLRAFNEACHNIVAITTSPGYKTCPIVPYSPPSREGTVALCAIVINEEAYLDEWIEYYAALGVSTVYIYDNTELFELENWRPLATFGGPFSVKIFHQPDQGHRRQRAAYEKCGAQALRDNHTWAGFVDVDEFLVLKKHDNVVDFLADHAPRGQLGINWYWFPTSGETLYRPLPVTKRFQFRHRNVKLHVKSFVRLQDMDQSRVVGSAHFVPMKAGQNHIDTSGKVLDGNPGPLNPGGPVDVAVVHHYNSKSQKEFIAKRMRGNANANRTAINATQILEESNNLLVGNTFDDSAWKLLKRNIQRYNIYDHL